jgi:hypothetical protein
MKNQLCNRIFDVLGKSKDDLTFLQLVEELHETPEILQDGEHGYDCLFIKSGFELRFDERRNCYSSIFFHTGSAMAESGAFKRYCHDLPSGINPGDSRELVEEKIGRKPHDSKLIPGANQDVAKDMDIWERYLLDGAIELTCIFLPTNKLRSVAAEKIADS